MSAAQAYEAQRRENVQALTARQRLEQALQPFTATQHEDTVNLLQPVPAPREYVRDPEAFTKGERQAYDRVLAFLDALPEQSATRTRDEGRGAAHATREIRQAVLTLREDSRA